MGGRYFPQEENRDLEIKIVWFLAILIAGLSLLLIRAWNLQVTNGKYYLALSENNRLRMVETPAPRGRIYDQHGSLLVNNIPSFNLYLVPGDIQHREAVIGFLSRIIEIPSEEIENRMIEKKGDPYKPIKIKEDLSLQEVAQIEGHGLQLSGVKIEAEFKRDAVFDSLAAHLLGYVGEVTKKQLEKERYQDVNGGTIIGQYGVEQTYDTILRGIPGEKKIEVDVLGHERQVIKEILPLRGDDIFLTLDLNVQKAAEAALSNRPGAIVALDPNNGDVLAMVSHPAFDPNVMSGGVSSKIWNALLRDKQHPLTNRAIHGQYPPGSTFKIISSVALLETETASPSDTVECRGTIHFGKRTFRDWKRWGHGKVDMRRSLVESCDIYYYEMGRELGVNTIARFSRLFGFGKPTGIDLAYEKGGLIPDKAWKRKTFNEPWYPGETLSVAIGQGFVSVTPIQLASMISTVANDGVWYKPHLLKKVRDHVTDQFTAFTSGEERHLPISKETFLIVRDALAGVVSERKGTASKFQSEYVSIGGKTGTAQVIGREALESLSESDTEAAPGAASDAAPADLPKKLQDHAWFIAFAPVKNPEIAVVVLVENGGHGGSAAAPLARRVIESYFDPRDPLDSITPITPINPLTPRDKVQPSPSQEAIKIQPPEGSHG